MPFSYVQYRVFNDRCSENFNMSLSYVVKMAIFKEVKQKRARSWSILQPLKMLEFWYAKGFQRESNT